jgi:hypothetical protein
LCAGESAQTFGAVFNSLITPLIRSFASLMDFVMSWISIAGLPGWRALWQ